MLVNWLWCNCSSWYTNYYFYHLPLRITRAERTASVWVNPYSPYGPLEISLLNRFWAAPAALYYCSGTYGPGNKLVWTRRKGRLVWLFGIIIILSGVAQLHAILRKIFVGPWVQQTPLEIKLFFTRNTFIIIKPYFAQPTHPCFSKSRCLNAI